MSDTLECARKDCGVSYTPKTHNQKYCTSECCRIATNRRIMDKYYAKQAQRQGKTRLCASCNVTKLSRYNDGEICGPCSLRKVEEQRASVLGMFAAISWQ